MKLIELIDTMLIRPEMFGLRSPVVLRDLAVLFAGYHMALDRARVLPAEPRLAQHFSNWIARRHGQRSSCLAWEKLIEKSAATEEERCRTFASLAREYLALVPRLLAVADPPRERSDVRMVALMSYDEGSTPLHYFLASYLDDWMMYSEFFDSSEAARRAASMNLGVADDDWEWQG